MKNSLHITKVDLIVFLSDPANYVNLFIMPVILALVLGFAMGGMGMPEHVRVDVINLDEGALSSEFLDQLHTVNNTLLLCPMDNDLHEESGCYLDQTEGYDAGSPFTVEQSRQRIQDGYASALIVIPEEYSNHLRTTTVAVEYYSRGGMAYSDAVFQSVRAAVQRINATVVASRVGGGMFAALSPESADVDAFAQAVYTQSESLWENPPVTVRYHLSNTGDSEETNTSSSNGFNQSVPGMATMFVLFTALNGLNLLIQERKQWTLQRLVTMPISRATLLGGKIIARVILGMITFGIMVLVGLLTKVNFGSDPFALILVMLSYTLCVTALTFALAPHLRSDEQAASIGVMLAIVLSALGGAWWPLEIVPGFMKVIGHFTPVAWAMDAFRELTFYNGALLDVLPYAGVLIAASLVLFVIGIKTFRYE